MTKPTGPHPRLTSLDASFLRVETPTAHMHVGWRGTFTPRHDGSRVDLESLRTSIASRLRHAGRFRQRLAFPPAGLGEPVWVDDEAFAVQRHVVAMAPERDVLSRACFDELCDLALSRPLPRDRALWRIELAPELEDGSIGLVMLVHHAMVDGKSAVELALLLLDLGAEPLTVVPEDRWLPERAPTPRALAYDAVRDRGAEGLRAARGAMRLAASPARGLRLADTMRRAALTVGEDLMRPAPSSYVNVPIGPRRTLLAHDTPIAPLLDARRAVAGATLNDVALTVVAGALRDTAMRAGQTPQRLKVMVPVSTRAPEEAASLGNQISFVFVALPVDLHRPTDRLAAIQAETARFKREGRASGGEALLGALGVLPGVLKDRAAKFAASPRMYNLTVSNVPGPRVPVYLLGCELQQAAPVIPLPDRHALSIRIFTYRDRLTFSVYADPGALPQVVTLPAALNAAVLELGPMARDAVGPPEARPLLRAVS